MFKQLVFTVQGVTNREHKNVNHELPNICFLGLLTYVPGKQIQVNTNTKTPGK